MLSLSERLSDPYQIAVWVNDGKLPHPPRFVFEGILTRDAFAGQLCQSKGLVDARNVCNADVATRTRFGRTKILVSEEVKLNCAPTKYGVVTETMNLAVKIQSPKKGQRVTHRPTGQYWNCDVEWLHSALDA